MKQDPLRSGRKFGVREHLAGSILACSYVFLCYVTYEMASKNMGFLLPVLISGVVGLVASRMMVLKPKKTNPHETADQNRLEVK